MLFILFQSITYFIKFKIVGDFYIVCIQNCNPRLKEEDAAPAVPALDGKDDKKKEQDIE